RLASSANGSSHVQAYSHSPCRGARVIGGGELRQREGTVRSSDKVPETGTASGGCAGCLRLTTWIQPLLSSARGTLTMKEAPSCGLVRSVTPLTSISGGFR